MAVLLVGHVIQLYMTRIEIRPFSVTVEIHWNGQSKWFSVKITVVDGHLNILLPTWGARAWGHRLVRAGGVSKIIFFLLSLR